MFTVYSYVTQVMELPAGIEPAPPRWQRDTIPLCYESELVAQAT